jgi:hypothetical protein
MTFLAYMTLMAVSLNADNALGKLAQNGTAAIDGRSILIYASTHDRE